MPSSERSGENKERREKKWDKRFFTGTGGIFGTMLRLMMLRDDDDDDDGWETRNTNTNRDTDNLDGRLLLLWWCHVVYRKSVSDIKRAREKYKHYSCHCFISSREQRTRIQLFFPPQFFSNNIYNVLQDYKKLIFQKQSFYRNQSIFTFHISSKLSDSSPNLPEKPIT